MYIILGASSGIGLVAIEQLSKYDDIIALYNSKKPNIKSKNKKIFYEKVDFTKVTSLEKVFIKYKKNLTNITCINLSAYKKDNLLFNMNYEDDLIKSFKINFFSTVLVVKALLPYMINLRSGNFIHISSTKAILGDVGASIYSSTKSSLIGFSNSLAEEYGRFNIRSNIISLGYFETNLWSSLPQKKREDLFKYIPLKRLGKISEIIKTIKFIKSNNYINKSVIKLDGGL